MDPQAQRILDEVVHKANVIIPFVLGRLVKHRERHILAGFPPPPMIVGLNGIQGSGKTTLVDWLAECFRSGASAQIYGTGRRPYRTAVLSIDDFYLTHADQVGVAATNPDNALVQHRGQPSTHDLALMQDVLYRLTHGLPVGLPRYDKSRHGGEGDRVEEGQWSLVNATPESCVELVFIEGWCLGFRPVGEVEVDSMWRDSQSKTTDDPAFFTRLRDNRLEDLLYIDRQLEAYDFLTRSLHCIIHLDVRKIQWVYQWRLEAERAQREAHRSGMTDEQVRRFIDGYYPSYELYTHPLRLGLFDSDEDGARQLRIVVNQDRVLAEVHRLVNIRWIHDDDEWEPRLIE